MPPEAARRVGVDRRTIYRALSAGTLRGGRVTTERGFNRWRVCTTDIDAWLDAGASTAEPRLERLPGEQRATLRAVKPSLPRRHYRHLLPTTGVWLALDALLVVGTLMLASGVMAHMDRSQRRARLGLRSWDPRGKVEPRSWAAPRDLRAGGRRLVAPGEDPWPRASLGARNASDGRRADPVGQDDAGGDSSRARAPRPGDRVVNKVDIIKETISQRVHRPVWIYAPMSETVPGRYTSGWTPIQGCEEWDFALRVGRWMFEADPASSAA